MSSNQPDEATLDLLIKQVTEGLSPEEQRALDVVDAKSVSAHLRGFEGAVAAITLAGTACKPLPSGLAQRLGRRADEYLAAAGGATDADAQDTIVGLDAVLAAARVASLARSAPAAAVSRNRTQTYGWIAAAACLLLAVFGWLRAPQAPQPGVPPVAALPFETAAAPPSAAPTVEQQRLALLEKPGTLKITLAPTKDPLGAGVSGDVVWDPQTQQGYMHFAGLVANDPSVRQYQLWIFDGERDQRYPVDGGVFDVPAAGGEVVIPIRAALMVRKPAAFAVTVEKPGGAVVSGREHIVVLGSAS